MSFFTRDLFGAYAVDQQRQFPLQQILFRAETFGIFHHDMALFVEVDEICSLRLILCPILKSGSESVEGVRNGRTA